MEINFKDICGHPYILSLPVEATVSDACHYLSDKLGISENFIFLVSPNENCNFYHNNNRINDVMKENPDCIIFTKCINSNLANFNQINSKYQLLSSNKNVQDLVCNKVITKNLNLCKNANKKINEKDLIYIQYSKCFTEVPDDLQQRIDEIAIFGYKIEDIKEALRNSQYNVLFAINSLVCESANEQEKERINRITKIIQNRPQILRSSMHYSFRNAHNNGFGNNSNTRKKGNSALKQYWNNNSNPNGNLRKWGNSIQNTSDNSNTKTNQWKSSPISSNRVPK